MSDISNPHRSEAKEFLISGDLVALGPLRRDLLTSYLRWRMDVSALLGLGPPRLHTAESILAWYEEATKPGSKQVNFTVYDLADSAPVGDTVINDLDFQAGTGEFGILLGERRSKGLGTEATSLTIDWGFNVLGLHNIMLTTFSWNVPAIRAYKKVGFHEIGRRREAVVTMGRRFDHILMDITCDEFDKSVLQKTIELPGSQAPAQ